MSSKSKNIFPLFLIVGAALLSFGAGSSRRYILPVRGGKLSSGFGERVNPITKKKEFHNGVDIALPEGSPVDSIASGKVSRIFTTDVGGLQMIIQNDDGSIVGFAHLSGALVNVGDRVKRGDVVALSGRSGKVTGAHLHLSIRNKAGKYIDPEDAFKF